MDKTGAKRISERFPEHIRFINIENCGHNIPFDIAICRQLFQKFLWFILKIVFDLILKGEVLNIIDSMIRGKHKKLDNLGDKRQNPQNNLVKTPSLLEQTSKIVLCSQCRSKSFHIWNRKFYKKRKYQCNKRSLLQMKSWPILWVESDWMNTWMSWWRMASTHTKSWKVIW